MFQHLFLEVAADLTIDGFPITTGRYHGHRVERKINGRKEDRVLLEIGRVAGGNQLRRSVDVTDLVGNVVMVVSSL